MQLNELRKSSVFNAPEKKKTCRIYCTDCCNQYEILCEKDCI